MTNEQLNEKIDEILSDYYNNKTLSILETSKYFIKVDLKDIGKELPPDDYHLRSRRQLIQLIHDTCVEVIGIKICIEQ